MISTTVTTAGTTTRTTSTGQEHPMRAMDEPDVLTAAFVAVAAALPFSNRDDVLAAISLARPFIEAAQRQRIRNELRRRVVPFRLQARDVNVDAVEWARIELALEDPAQ